MKPTKKVSVLLVEDNKLVRKMSILILEQLKCEVDAVETGADALAHAEKNPYDIIFMDIGLPDIDGLNVIHQIRKKSKWNSKAPIIALTAHSDTHYRSESYKKGATDFVVKPFNNSIGQDVLARYVAED